MNEFTSTQTHANTEKIQQESGQDFHQQVEDRLKPHLGLFLHLGKDTHTVFNNLARHELAGSYLSLHQGLLQRLEQAHTPDQITDLVTDMVTNPSQEPTGLNESIENWVLTAISEEVDKQRRFLELKARHPDNPLFTTTLSELPSTNISVYHFTGEEMIDKIAQHGLLPYFQIPEIGQIIKSQKALAKKNLKHYLIDDMRHKWLGEKIIDSLKPDDKPARLNSSFGYLHYHNVPNMGNGGGGIVIEVSVDPNDTYIADARLLDEIDLHLGTVEQDDGWMNSINRAVVIETAKYWKTCMKLSDYQALPPNQRPRYIIPEILIPGVISPDKMRIKKIENVM